MSAVNIKAVSKGNLEETKSLIYKPESLISRISQVLFPFLGLLRELALVEEQDVEA